VCFLAVVVNCDIQYYVHSIESCRMSIQAAEGVFIQVACMTRHSRGQIFKTVMFELLNNILQSSKSKGKITTNLLLAPYSHSNSNSLSRKDDLHINKRCLNLLPVSIDDYNIIIHYILHL